MNWPVVLATAVGLLGTAGWFWRRPEHGLAAVIALLPFERLGSFALGLNGQHLVRPSQVAAAALIAALVARLVTERTKPLRFRSVGWLALSALISTAMVGSLRLWENYLALLLAIGAFWATAQTASRFGFRLARRWLFISAAGVSLFGLFQYLGDLAGWSHHLTGLRPEYSSAVLGYARIHSTALEPLFFANYLLLPLLIGLALAADRQLKRWEIASLGLVGLAFLLTESRGAFAVFTVGLIALVVVIWQRQAKRLLNWRLVAAAATLIAVAGVLLVVSSNHSRGNALSGPRQFWQLLTTEFTTSASFTERQTGQTRALSVIKHSPWFGVGVGRFTTPQLHYPPKRYNYDSIYVNNTPLALACEIGLVGLALWLWLVASQFWTAISQLRRQFNYAVLGATLAAGAILLQSLTFYGLFLTHIWVALGLMSGLALRTKKAD